MEPVTTGHSYHYKLSKEDFVDRLGIRIPGGEFLVEVNATRFGGHINIVVQTEDDD